jgi:lauroyl/myristoyl acyltransferase
MKGFFKGVRHRIEWLAVSFLAIALPMLPRFGAMGLAKFLGKIWFMLDAKSRAVALANLKLAFPTEKSDDERREIALKSFQRIAQTTIDVFWSKRLNASNYNRWIQMEGFDKAREIASVKGGIFVCIHYGSFEWLALGPGFYGMHGGVLAQSFKNPLLEPLYNSMRAAAGQRMITRAGGMLPIMRILKQGGFVGMLVDLTLPTKFPSRITSIFGALTNVTCIQAILHKRTGAPIIPIEARPNDDGTCRIIAHPPLNVNPEMSEAEIVRMTWDFFEPQIRARPDLWLWAYKHWRYRNPTDPESAPFYANRSSLFDKKMKAEGLMA